MNSNRTSQIITFLFLLVFCSTGNSQPEVQWSKNYGGTHLDVLYSISQTSDEGYIVAGHSYSNDVDVSGNYGESDIWVLKLNALGDIEWEKNYGGSDTEEIRSILQTADGGYILCGTSSSSDFDVNDNNGATDYWIVKLNTEGDIEWNKNFGGSSWDWALAIKQTADGGYIVAGSTMSNDGDVGDINGSADFWIIKLDANGTVVWKDNFGGGANDNAFSIEQTNDGNYAIAGNSSSYNGDVGGNYGYADVWFVTLDSNGNLIYEQNHGGSEADNPQFIQQTSDEGFFLLATSGSSDVDASSNNGMGDIWALKLNAQKEIEWENNFGGSLIEAPAEGQQTSDGGYVFIGTTESDDGDVTNNHGVVDYWIIKVNSLGEMEWELSMGGSEADFGESIQQTTDGGYILAGTTHSNDGDVLDNYGSGDFWIVKLLSIPTDVKAINKNIDINIYPNPSNGNIKIDIDDLAGSYDINIQNILGAVVYSSPCNDKSCEITGLPAGVYNISITFDNYAITKKILVY